MGAEARAALEVEEPGQRHALAFGGDHLAAVQLDPLAVGLVVVQGHAEAVVGEDDSGLAVGGGAGVGHGLSLRVVRWCGWCPGPSSAQGRRARPDGCHRAAGAVGRG
ncbi:hypothetical protein ACFQVA_01670 [Actinomadura keratinilytica]